MTKPKNKRKGILPISIACELKDFQKPILNGLNGYSISILVGEAGTAKDFIQMYRAITGLIKGEFEHIVILKPTVELGNKNVGFLPGEISDKVAPYKKSFEDSVKKMITTGAHEVLTKMTFEHSGFQRGVTYKNNSAVIVSEAQNFNLHELISIVTRLPEDSVMYMNGDLDQIDVKDSGLAAFLKIVDGMDGVNIQRMEPAETFQMRNGFITELMKRYKAYKNDKGAIPGNKK